MPRGSILRTHVLRPTWHFVAREDLRWLLGLTGPRIQRANRSRYRDLGLDDEILERSRAAIAAALEGGHQLMRDQIGQVLEREGIDVSGQRLPYLMMDCELEAIICSGARAGKHHTYALVDERVPRVRPPDRQESVVGLTRRYLAGHGPASIHDLSWWSSVTVADLKRALDALGPDVERRKIDGVELVAMSSTEADPGGGKRRARKRRAHLLQSYDEIIVGYTKTRFLGDPRADAARRAWKDRSLPHGLVLLDDKIAGHWRRTIDNINVQVEVLLYEEPGAAERTALNIEAGRLAGFVQRSLKLEIAQFQP